ncbi:hypothetical protein FJT64_015433 [Amphibalanus amphitrite]|uniref:Chitin-binding type-2 domain-containing protein n=1 Tax=Amphibalanus amphitrite TaxID=1232801 RepID=A0A6A4XGV1_AMPAM|nr:hypothetical protein FJT64_015433 [Amphibalanus amphitrite]
MRLPAMERVSALVAALWLLGAAAELTLPPSAFIVHSARWGFTEGEVPPEEVLQQTSETESYLGDWCADDRECSFLTSGVATCQSNTCSCPEGLVPTSKSECVVCSEGVQYMIDETDCTKYYQCSNGKPVSMSCSSPLVWNDQINTCDYISNVPRCR